MAVEVNANSSLTFRNRQTGSDELKTSTYHLGRLRAMPSFLGCDCEKGRVVCTPWYTVAGRGFMNKFDAIRVRACLLAGVALIMYGQ